MDKLHVVYYAVFSKQNQGIKSYWSFLWKVLSQHYFSNTVILIAVCMKLRVKNVEELIFSEVKWLIQKSRVKLEGKIINNTKLMYVILNVLDWGQFKLIV